MPEIHSVLVTTLLSPENKMLLEQALAPATVYFCTPKDREYIAQHINEVDVAILNGDADDLILSGKGLRWIHCCHAGLDRTIRPEIFERDIILTSSSGRSAPALAEHVLMFMLTLTYDLPFLTNAKNEHRWAAGREYFYKTGLYGKTVGIIGLGKTGCEVARLAKQFDMKVLGWRRSAEKPVNVDHVYSSDHGDSLIPLLEESDYVVLCAELNDETWHLIDESAFSHMKSTAFIINLARGAIIDESAMIDALQQGKIAGAGLDTFEIEPLPEDSPLWDMPNVIITPHMTPRLPDRDDRALRYALKNIDAYRRGEGFVNRLNLRDMYTHQRK